MLKVFPPQIVVIGETARLNELKINAEITADKMPEPFCLNIVGSQTTNDADSSLLRRIDRLNQAAQLYR